MAKYKGTRKQPATTQVELDVFLGAAEQALGKLVYARTGPRAFSQFAYREDWLSDSRYFDISPDLAKTMGYQVRKAATKDDSTFFFALADTEPDTWGRRVIARAHAKERQNNPALGPLTELDYLCAVDDRNLRGKPRGSVRGSSEQAGTACGFLRCIAYDDAHREYKNPSTPYQRQARQSAASDGA